MACLDEGKEMVGRLWPACVCSGLRNKKQWAYYERKFSEKTSGIQKVELPTERTKGSPALRTVSPRSRDDVQIAWQAQHFGNLRCRFRGSGRRVICSHARSSTDFVAGAFARSGAEIDREDR